jgi:anti-sigma factor RsiW
VSCNSAEALFEAYLDDTLLPARRARLLAHVNACGRCKGVLQELRVVDALIASPRVVELPENFTFATMAEVRSLPRPCVSSAPLYALLIGAGFLLAPSALRAFGETALDGSAQLARTFGVFGHAGVRVLGDFRPLGAFLGAAIVLDLAVVLALVVGFTVVRPRLAERLRS